MAEIIRCAIGRVACMGHLYDARTDNFLEYSQFNSFQTTASDFSESEIKYIMSDDYLEKFDALRVERELGASISANLVPVNKLKGCGKYLKIGQKNNKIRQSLLYSITTYDERLIEDEKFFKIVSSHNFKCENSTHYVAGIIWGTNTVVTLETEENKNGNVDLITPLYSLGVAILNQDQNAFSALQNTKGDFTIRLFSDVMQETVRPKTIRETGILLKDIPYYINKRREKQVTYLLRPLDNLKKYLQNDIPLQFFPINEEDLLKFIRFGEEIIRMIRRICCFLDLFTQHYYCVPEKCKMRVERVQLKLCRYRDNFKQAIYDIRSGKSNEESLDEMHKEIHDLKLLEAVEVELQKCEILISKIRLAQELQSKSVIYVGRNEDIKIGYDEIKDLSRQVYGIFLRAETLADKFTQDEIKHFLYLIENKADGHSFVAIDLDARPDLEFEELNENKSQMCVFVKGQYHDFDYYTKQLEEKLIKAREEEKFMKACEVRENASKYDAFQRKTSIGDEAMQEKQYYQKETNQDDMQKKQQQHKQDAVQSKQLQSDATHEKHYRQDVMNEKQYTQDDMQRPHSGDFMQRQLYARDDKQEKQYTQVNMQRKPYAEDDMQRQQYAQDEKQRQQYAKDMQKTQQHKQNAVQSKQLQSDATYEKQHRQDTMNEKQYTQDDMQRKPYAEEDMQRQQYAQDDMQKKQYTQDEMQRQPYTQDEMQRQQYTQDDMQRKQHNQITKQFQPDGTQLRQYQQDHFHDDERNKDEEKILNELTPKKELNVLILGINGVGKSTWINSIANYFKYSTLEEAASNPLLSVTPTSFQLMDENYKMHDIRFGDGNEDPEPGVKAHTFEMTDDTVLRLIDTPGIGSRGLEQDKANLENILQFITTLKCLNGICILLKPNESRLSVLFEYFIKQLLTELHPNAMRNIVFCFTHTRETFYKPGDTRQLLSGFLRKSNLNVGLTKDTMYCIDNEGFRYLCAKNENVCIEEMENKMKTFSESWYISVTETNRLIDYLRTLEPHVFEARKILNTKTINNSKNRKTGEEYWSNQKTTGDFSHSQNTKDMSLISQNTRSVFYSNSKNTRSEFSNSQSASNKSLSSQNVKVETWSSPDAKTISSHNQYAEVCTTNQKTADPSMSNQQSYASVTKNNPKSMPGSSKLVSAHGSNPLFASKENDREKEKSRREALVSEMQRTGHSGIVGTSQSTDEVEEEDTSLCRWCIRTQSARRGSQPSTSSAKKEKSDDIQNDAKDQKGIMNRFNFWHY